MPLDLAWPAPWNSANSCAYSEGNSCWFYCDASSYFKAFIAAAQTARSHIFIVGWDIHTETNLAPEYEHSFVPRHWSLSSFLLRLLSEQPQLHIYLLGWDYSPVYFLEREKLQSLRFAWFNHPRLHFMLDSQHPLSGSHHQKIVVVDDQIGFIGGLDLTIRRWDTCEHRAEHPLRKDPSGVPYPPFHDTQMGLSGPAVAALSTLVRERWRIATGHAIEQHQLPSLTRENPLPDATAASFRQVRLAISRTNPLFRDQPEIREIAQTYADLLRRAQRFIYIENQYLTSQLIVDTISELSSLPQGPEIIVILPEKSGGWLEKKTMGNLQAAALRKMREADLHGRLHVYYPYDRKLERRRKYVTVHSKILIVDGIFLTVGSANLNNRSMGFDTECNATIDTQLDPVMQGEIMRVVAFLIAHFCQLKTDDILLQLQQGQSLAEVIAALQQNSPRRHLRPLPAAAAGPLEAPWLDAQLLDMERPAPIELAMDRWGRLSDTINRRLGMSPRSLALIATALVAIGLSALWTLTPFPAYLEQLGLRYGLEYLAPDELRTALLFLAIFALASLFFVPINLLIIGTASLFSSTWAFAYILIGIIANVSAGYGLGILAGRHFFRQFFGRKTRTILHRIGEGHFLAIALLRLVPIAPSSVINMAAGAGRIPFLKFLGASLVGMLPGTVMLVIFQKSIMDLFKHPTWGSIAILLLIAAVALGLYRWSRLRFSNYGQ